MRQDLADDAFPAVLGAGQTVAVIDTGIDYRHPALGGGYGPGFKVVGGFDFVDNDNDPIDTFGHGTQVAGMIASNAFSSGGFIYRGVAPDAKLIALRVGEDTSSVPLSRLRDALNWVADNAATFGIGIVNVSFGFGAFTSDGAQDSDDLDKAVAAVRAKNIFITSSSGNSGTADEFGITYPASDPGAISVGSVDGSDTISDFTQRSSNLDFLAVGDGIRSPTINSQFAQNSGTSFAAPTVAGLIALVRSVDASIAYNDVISLLRASSRPNLDGDTEIGNVTTSTYARIDIYGAIALAQQRRAGNRTQQFSATFNGRSSAVAVDAQGVTHVVYFDASDRRLEYAVRRGDGQFTAPSVIDSSSVDIGQQLSMRLDAFGRPSVAYYDSANGDLRYARLDSTGTTTGLSWKIETVDATNNTGQFPSIVIDRNLVPHIAYYRVTGGDLRVASRYPMNGNTWRLSDVDTSGDVGRGASAQLDTSGRLAIALADTSNGRLRFVRQTNNLSADATPVWNRVTVPTPPSGTLFTLGAASISLAIDASNRPHVSYQNVGPGDLNYATLNGSSWTVEAVATRRSVGWFSQMYIDGTTPRILAWDRSFNQLMRYTRGSTTWSAARISTNGGQFVSVGQDFSRASRFVAMYLSTSTGRLVRQVL
jgi:hypothetical protein